MIFVTIKTFDLFSENGESSRDVTLSYSPEHRDQGVVLLGGLPHGTRIVVDQTLVDDLQNIVNLHYGKGNY